MPGQQPYRMIVRHSIVASVGRDVPAQIEQVGDVYPPGMVGNDIHPWALGRLVCVCRGRELDSREG
jgi:hypothetical protein